MIETSVFCKKYILFTQKRKIKAKIKVIKAKMGSFNGLIRLASYYFALFMALKTKMESLYVLIRHLFLTALCLRF